MNRNGVMEYWIIGVMGQERKKHKPCVVSLTLIYNSLRVVIPAKAGIQIEKTGFPRIKYGAG